MAEIMLDLETMGVNPNAPIVAIGAVLFDDNNVMSEFYQTVTLKSSMELGAIPDASTIEWWIKQSAAAKDATFTKGIHINEALVAFSTWCAQAGPAKYRNVWGNGASFDNVLLRQSYARSNLITPWDWWNDRCYRTIAAQNKNIPKTITGVEHHALDDAKTQALHLMEILKWLK